MCGIRHGFRVRFFLFLICGTLLVAPFLLDAAPPALRTEILLDGSWNFTPEGGAKTTIPVPEYWDAKPGFTADRAVYERAISIPASWAGSVIQLEFEGVAHIADVYLDNRHLGRHVGAWIPFSYDITDFAEAGRTHVLKVEVKGGKHQPIMSASGKPAWPVGYYGFRSAWGIPSSVRLRAYGPVHIVDAFIQTSYRERQLRVEYTLRNAGRSARTVRVEGEAVRAGSIEKSIASTNVTLQPGEKKTIVAAGAWASPALWMPDMPALYHLRSSVIENSSRIDTETRRFGFREIWTEGNKFLLNGIRLNLRGDNLVDHAQGFKWDDGLHRYSFLTPSVWPNTVDRLKSYNINVVRFHQQPAPEFALHIADEKGLLVIDESALYARDYYAGSDKPVLLANTKTWLGPWIRARRNHPSVIMWSAENEMGKGSLQFLTDDELKTLGAEIRKFDTTRPVVYEGERDVGEGPVNYHYSEGYEKRPSGSIYKWADKVSPARPTGTGEMITSYGANEEANKWWQGTWSRGLRYIEYADIRPYTLHWAWKSNLSGAREQNLRNSFHPVALFDKAYDDLGIEPLRSASAYPAIAAQTTRNGVLVLYNDEFRQTEVDVEVTVTANGRKYAEGKKRFTVALGHHIDIPYSFQVPQVGGSTLEVTLGTRKDGVKRFEEVKRFKVTGASGGAQTSAIVSFSGAGTSCGNIFTSGTTPASGYAALAVDPERPCRIVRHTHHRPSTPRVRSDD